MTSKPSMLPLSSSKPPQTSALSHNPLVVHLSLPTARSAGHASAAGVATALLGSAWQVGSNGSEWLLSPAGSSRPPSLVSSPLHMGPGSSWG